MKGRRKRKSWASLNFSFKLYFIFLPLFYLRD